MNKAPAIATESWRITFRKGIAPQLSTRTLEALRKALETDDKRLIQGATTSPPPLACVQDWPVEAGCALGFCGAVEHGGFLRDDQGNLNESSATVAQAEEFFAQTCFQCDQLLQEPAACRFFLNWFDDRPRHEMIAELLPEVARELELRAGQ